jgi:hypothetical protein
LPPEAALITLVLWLHSGGTLALTGAARGKDGAEKMELRRCRGRGFPRASPSSLGLGRLKADSPASLLILCRQKWGVARKAQS